MSWGGSKHIRPKKAQLKALRQSCMSVNEKGHLTINGHDTVELAQKFGTPLWVVSEPVIRNNFKTFLKSFRHSYPTFDVAYGAKANHAPAVLRILLQEGALIDFVSLTQLYLAKAAGADPSRLIFNGNNKTSEELKTAVENGVGLINVDSMDELKLLNQICKSLDKRQKITIRVKGSYSSLKKTDPAFVAMSTKEDKFGIDIPSGQALQACKVAVQMDSIQLVGLHHHIGWSAYRIPYDRDKDLNRVKCETSDIVDFMLMVESKIGMKMSVLDLGGGFRKPRPHPFGPGKITSIPQIEEYAEVITEVIRRKALSNRSDLPKLVLEPGGYMVTDAVTLLSTVGNIKSVNKGPGRGKWIAVDSSAYMFVRKLIFEFYHHTFVANKMSSASKETVDIVGNTCAYDYIADKVTIPHVERGDLIATLDQGSYCETVSTQYCGILRPAVVLVNNQDVSIIKRRETPEDILSLYSIPPWLDN